MSNMDAEDWGIFFNGMTTCAYLVAALFFLRFWRRSGDRLFAAFAFAFTLFGCETALQAIIRPPLSDAPWAYVLRIAGFATIAWAVFMKNYG